MRSANAHITVTVFPFENLSLERELGIFCRSFSVDLVNELSRFRQFQVAGTNYDMRPWQVYLIFG